MYSRRATYSTGTGCAGCTPCKTGTIRHWQMAPNDHYNLTLFTSMPKLNTLSWNHPISDDSVMLSIFLQQPFALDVFVGRKKLRDDYDVGVTEDRLPTLKDRHGEGSDCTPLYC